MIPNPKGDPFMSDRNDFYVSPRISKKALNAFLAHFTAGADELHTLEISVAMLEQG